ncbi:hypothetical protein [Epibacterium ulvae]|uniref:hypothetical protein n=1 Tax=Epibacterium ulvae TaxID=1156985 RepID=UPI0024911CE6|nr:hypothetical protein [Epibacterium ulvae]
MTGIFIAVETTETGMENAQIGAFLNEVGLSADAIRYFTFAGSSEELLDIMPEIA